jgi:hypothetical protein
MSDYSAVETDICNSVVDRAQQLNYTYTIKKSKIVIQEAKVQEI